MPKVFWIVAGAAAVAAGALAIALTPVSHAHHTTAPDEAAYAEPPSGTAPQPASSSTKTAVVPIIVYHIVRPSYPSDDASVKKYAVTPDIFDAQLQHLQEAGYHVIGFHDLESYLSAGTPLPTKPIILSFDDGWGDQYTYAFPLLEKHHDTATFFVFTNAIGTKGFLTWADLKEMLNARMTVGDHSKSHPYLNKISDPNKLWDEIAGSKQLLESKLGVTITEFAYPFGQYNDSIISLVKKAGYKSARADFWSGNTQSADHLYELSAVNVPTTVASFDKKFP